MKLRKFIKTGLLKNVQNGKGILFIGLIAGLALLIEMQGNLSRLFLYSAIADSSVMNFFTNMYSNTYWIPLLHMLAAYLSLYDFCQEWRNGYWKPIEVRTGKYGYIIGRIVIHYVETFLIMFLGQLLFLAILFGIGAWYHLPVISEYDYSVQLPSHPYLYLFLRILVFSFASAFWSLAAMLITAMQLDLFAGVVIPVTMHIALDYIGAKSPIKIQLSLVARMAISWNALYCVIVAIAVFGCLSCICIYLIARLIKKRIENELHS